MKKIENLNINLKDFKLNEEGSFSITRPYESYQIIYLINNFIKLYDNNHNTQNMISKIITDGTACMGGDVIRFSKYFKMINAVEILKDNFELLVENCKYFNCNNVNLFMQDYLEIYDKLNQDIIYLDPPWTGPGYKNKESIVLKLNNMEISDLVENIKKMNLAKYVFIKAPSNVCLDKLNYDSIHTVYNKSKVASFKLICICLMK